MKENQTELIHEPKGLGLPKEFTWPKDVEKEIDVWDTAYMEWDDVHATLSEKHAALKAAKAKDAKAFVDAVSEGKPDPGTKASEKAERDVVYWEEVVRQARGRADKQGGLAWQKIQANYQAIVAEANARAVAGADEFAAEVEEIAHRSKQAVENRQRALEGLRFVSRLTGRELSFDPFFPVDGSFSVPRTSETRIRSTVKLLEDTIQRKQSSVAEYGVDLSGATSRLSGQVQPWKVNSVRWRHSLQGGWSSRKISIFRRYEKGPNRAAEYPQGHWLLSHDYRTR